MLDKIEIKKDFNKEKVIEYLKSSELDLERFTIKDFKDFPGAIELIDRKGRSIVFYYNYLVGEVEIVYKDLKKFAEEVYILIDMILFPEYKSKSEEIGQIVKREIINEKYMRFSKKVNPKSKIIELTKMFDIHNELYDIYEYLKNQIDELDIVLRSSFKLNLLRSIDELMLESSIKKKLKDKKITTFKQLCGLKKSELNKKGFNQYEIEQIEIKLQLEGLDLKR